MLLYQTWGQFVSSTLFTQLYEWLHCYRYGYLYTNSIHALIAAWLDTSQRSRDGVRLNKSAIVHSEKLCDWSQRRETLLFKHVPLL